MTLPCFSLHSARLTSIHPLPLQVFIPLQVLDFELQPPCPLQPLMPQQ